MGRTASECLKDITKEELVPGGVAVIEFGGNDSDICWADVSRDPTREYPARSTIPQACSSRPSFCPGAARSTAPAGHAAAPGSSCSSRSTVPACCSGCSEAR